MAGNRKNRMVLIILVAGIIPILVFLAAVVFNAKSLENSSGPPPIFIIALVGIPVLLTFFFVFKFFRKPFASFFGGSKDTRRILATGRPARARVLQIGESSLGGTITVNNQPFVNLQVEIEDGTDAPYTTSIDTIIPRTAIPQFQPGAVIPVKIDPTDKLKIAIDWQSGRTIQASGAADSQPTVGNVSDWTATDNQLLEEQGIDGTAKILSIVETGRSEDFQPVVTMTYEVRSPGRDTYTFTKDVPLPTAVAKKVKKLVRKTFKAKIHPTDPHKIKIDIRF